MSQQTQINGNRYSFTNIIVSTSAGDIPRGVFKSITYDAMQDAGIVQGNQTAPVGRTGGYGTSTGSFEMLVSELDDFFANITQNGAIPIMAAEFDMVIAYSVNDIDTRIDSLIGCRITKIGSANQQGNEATTKTCDISIMRPKLNGIDAYADPGL